LRAIEIAAAESQAESLRSEASTSVTGIEFGASIQLDREQFGRVATAFFDELQTRFL
jgi:hypothetical protein